MSVCIYRDYARIPIFPSKHLTVLDSQHAKRITLCVHSITELTQVRPAGSRSYDNNPLIGDMEPLLRTGSDLSPPQTVSIQLGQLRRRHTSQVPGSPTDNTPVRPQQQIRVRLKHYIQQSRRSLARNRMKVLISLILSFLALVFLDQYIPVMGHIWIPPRSSEVLESPNGLVLVDTPRRRAPLEAE